MSRSGGARQTSIEDLRSRIEGRLPGGSRVKDVTRLMGGYSGETFRVDLAGDEGRSSLVLKVAPAGLEPVRNRDVLRQAKLLDALGPTPVRVPSVVFTDAGEPPDVPPLFAMTFVPGESLEPNLDEVDRLPAPEVLRDRCRDAARQLAVLHQVELRTVGLEQEPVGTLADEIVRWETAFASVPDELRQADDPACAAALRGAMPETRLPSLLHGDYRLGNTLCVDGAVAAVIDWEIWSVGDARLDLAWYLMALDPSLHPSLVRAAPGVPPVEAMCEDYVAAGGAPVTDLAWFQALTLYKLAATTALLVKRQLRGGRTPAEIPAASFVPIMVERALTLLG